MQNKIFRLFISSTFNDFRREREVLQTKVFPHIKEYALKAGYTFQPIDLRWGVSNEAQLDQKTLELCLEEVRACKTHIHPNFLIMIGDRYGWIPLPYVIEVKEFEELLLLVNDNEKQQLLEWYIKDLNQLPASYILKERVGEYENFDTWNKIEINLHDILQSAVNNSNLNEEQKRKYFLSATEAEVEEGIIPYIKPTKFQRDELLSKKENKDLETVDPEHIFGFFRDVDKYTKIEDKFIDDDYAKAQLFKERVDNVLLDENVLHIKTKQIDKETLEENYLVEFEERMIKFLESQVDMQKTQETKDKLTPLQIEIQAQRIFSDQKRRDFIETKELELLLSTVSDYISSRDKKPLVIYGPSGRGKSSFMARAIEYVKDKNPLYRFVGATPNSGSSKDILTSIFAELGIDVRSKQGARDETLIDIDEKQETFEQFSERVYAEFTNIKQETVIFIDAVDQLGNDDQFLWLPRQLPSNVKIIISALDDENYKDDSQYFQTLKSMTDFLYEIPVFSEPRQLLYVLLEKENRTLQKDQEDYFVQQFQTANSPLYVSIAAQELKNWKSSDYVEDNSFNKKGKKQDLKPTQKGIIQEFIVNLSNVYYHNEEFVTKVLGYLYASRDGLNESELLQLISADEGFVKKMAPETWHENPNKELPLVHWSRLHTQLKAFLKTQGPEELMYFFHREFEDIISNLPNQREEHERIIEANRKIILSVMNEKFYSNRWGIIYTVLIEEYRLRYSDEEIWFGNDKLIESLSYAWRTSFLKYLYMIFIVKYNDNKYRNAMALGEIADSSHRVLYALKSSYRHSGENFIWIKKRLADLYTQSKNITKATGLLEESLSLIEKFRNYRQTLSKERTEYIIKNDLAVNYMALNRIDEAFKIIEQQVAFFEDLYKRKVEINDFNIKEDYALSLINLGHIFYLKEEFEKALYYEKKSIEIYQELDEKHKISARRYYEKCLHISYTYRKNNHNEKAQELALECLEFVEKQFKIHKDRYSKFYVSLLLFLYDYDSNYLLKGYQIAKEYYDQFPGFWIERYTEALALLVAYYFDSSQYELYFKYAQEQVCILEKEYNQNKEVWGKAYCRALQNRAINFNDSGDLETAIMYLENVKNLYKYAKKEKYGFYNEFELLQTLMLQSNYYKKAEKYHKQAESLDEIILSAVGFMDQLSMQSTTDPRLEIYLFAFKQLIKLFNDIYEFKRAIKYKIQYLEYIRWLFSQDEEKWAEEYTVALINISTAYYNTNEMEERSEENLNKWIEYKEENLVVCRNLFKKDSERYEDKYLGTFNNIIQSYKKMNRYRDIAKVREEHMEVIRSFYRNDQAWERKYVESLYNLASSYVDLEEVDDAISTFKELHTLLCEVRGEGHQSTQQIRTYLENLISWRESNQ